MTRILVSLFLSGFLWLLLFSIPIDSQRRLFDVGHDFIIDSVPVRWLAETFQNYIVSLSSKNPTTISQTEDNSSF